MEGPLQVSSFHANWMKTWLPEAILDSDGPIFKILLPVVSEEKMKL
jgi:hypothetical protein